MRRLLSVLFFSFLLLQSCKNSTDSIEDNTNQTLIHKKEEAKKKVEIEKNAYGFRLNDYQVVQDTVSNGDFFASIMDKHGVTPTEVYNITHSIPDSIFDFRRLNVGRPYTILKSNDSLSKPLAFIYENNKIDYTKVYLEDSIYGERDKKPVVIKTRIATGVINSSLSLAIDDAGLDYMLANRLADVYQWTIDFFRIDKGDRFKVIFKEQYINDTIYAGIKSVDAAIFEHRGKAYYAFEYEVDKETGRKEYFDENAKTLRRFFLKAPVDYKRISSRYSPRRFHPVQKRWKAHKGTDYAAARGTPIWSTANGVVTKSGYTRGNGNYVKIKHTNKYSTQYLHMSKRAVKVGQRVNQGEVIGYVGSTGLATGPHVCYRFWVNGKQVDPFKQKLPSAEPMPEDLKPTYYLSIKESKAELEKDFIFKNDLEIEQEIQ